MPVNYIYICRDVTKTDGFPELRGILEKYLSSEELRGPHGKIPELRGPPGEIPKLRGPPSEIPEL